MDNISFFASLPMSFVDPVTGLPPSNERELSALLAVFHQRRRVSWNRVKLYREPNDPVLTADSLFAIDGAIACEYPLFAKSREQVDTWGLMPADLIYLRNDGATVVVIENKIGSRFTSGGDHPELGQLGRQAEYLARCNISKRYLILLSTADCFRTYRYSEVLLKALGWKDRSDRVQGYLMYWEEILATLR